MEVRVRVQFEKEYLEDGYNSDYAVLISVTTHELCHRLSNSWAIATNATTNSKASAVDAHSASWYDKSARHESPHTGRIIKPSLFWMHSGRQNQLGFFVMGVRHHTVILYNCGNAEGILAGANFWPAFWRLLDVTETK